VFKSTQARYRVASVNGICKSAVSGSADNGQKSCGALSPKSAVRQFSDRLTNFEQQEVYSYSQIYYVGVSLSCKKKNTGTATDNENNNGYDDDEHAYKLRVHDHIFYRYEILKVIGKGSFGQVR
jgi:dual specificity tyrosine-phosphorylation-regulated kinase 2/3/4